MVEWDNSIYQTFPQNLSFLVGGAHIILLEPSRIGWIIVALDFLVCAKYLVDTNYFLSVNSQNIQ